MVRVVVLALALAALSRDALAIPRFAARNGAPCAMCHVNPSGAGLRTAYGRAVFERQRLPSPWVSQLLGEGADFRIDPRLGEAISIGTDLRAAYLRGMPRTGPPSLDSFFLMEANLYVGAELGRHTTFSYTQGAYGSFEAFGMLHFGLRDGPPDRLFAGYLKLGRFVPTYGLRLESHSTFTREGLGFGATMRDTGVELGLNVGPVWLQASYLRGALTDKDPEGTAYARLEWIVRTELVKHLIGVSASYNPNAVAANPAIGVTLAPELGLRELRLGAHLGLSIGRFAYLGEIDRVANESRKDLTEARALVSYQELSFVPVQGLDLQVTHEYTDPDLALAAGRLQRIGGGLELYPWEYTELKVTYRRTLGPRGHPLDGSQEIVAMAHLFF